MAFVGSDIQAALGAGWPELAYQLDGTLDLDDAATLFGVGAVMNTGGGPPPPAGGGFIRFRAFTRVDH